jgi:hypothetical protein
MAKKPKLQRKPPRGLGKQILGSSIRVPRRVSGYVIYPSGVHLAKSYVHRAQKTGLVKNASEFALGVHAMIAAGMSKAKESNVKYVNRTQGRIRRIILPPSYITSGLRYITSGLQAR